MLFSLILTLLLMIDAQEAFAATYKCIQDDGSETYSDHRIGTECRELQPAVINKGGSSPQKAPPDVDTDSNRKKPAEQGRKEIPKNKVPSVGALLNAPIRTVKLKVPLLSVSGLPAPFKEAGYYLADAGELVMTDLEVGHNPNGYGPDVRADYHFRNIFDKSLELAVWAAGKAIGYDPRYLRVRLSVQLMLGADSTRFDGPSATMPLAIAIAAAILGDRLRPEACMSGTLNEKLEVGPVGGLEEKIRGCRKLGYRELVIPAGQLSMDLALKGMSYEIKVTEVNTFSGAYEAIIGKPIRSLR